MGRQLILMHLSKSPNLAIILYSWPVGGGVTDRLTNLRVANMLILFFGCPAPGKPTDRLVEEIKRPLSESGVDDVKHKNDPIPSPRASQKLFWVAANPKGGNQAPSIRIRGRRCKTQKRPNTEPQGVPETLVETVRLQIAPHIV